MSLDKVFFYILLFIIPLYFLQGWLFDHGSFISQSIAAIWLIIDVIYLIKCIRIGKIGIVGRYFLLFWILQTITWIITSFLLNSRFNIGLSETYSLYKNISIAFLSYFPFFFFVYRSIIDEKLIKVFAILSFLGLLGAYFISYNEMVYTNDTVDIANRGAYYLVVIIPLLGLFFNNTVEFAFYGGIAVLVLTGAKRGAILCVSIELLLFVYYYIKASLQRKSSLKFIWILIGVSVLFYVIANIYQGNEFLQERYDQTLSGDSSLRDEIYSLALYKYGEQGFVHKIFGNGMSSTLGILGGYAHQDWLELLINNGLLGVLVYALVFMSLLFFYRKNKRVLSIMEKFMFVSALLGWLMRSMFSMGYVSIETSFFVIVFGLICANKCKYFGK